jgi:FG-GAP-like repeat
MGMRNAKKRRDVVCAVAMVVVAGCGGPGELSPVDGGAGGDAPPPGSEAPPRCPDVRFPYAQWTPLSDLITGLAALDLDGDGFDDLLTVDYQGDYFLVTRSNGDGTFREPTAVHPQLTWGIEALAVSPGSASSPPLVAAVGSERAIIYAARSDGALEQRAEVPLAWRSNMAIFADVNRDEVPDLVTASGAGALLQVVLGQVDGSFRAAVTYPTPGGPAAMAAAHLDGDAFLDLGVLLGSSGRLGVLTGDGDGAFQPVVTHQLAADPVAMALVDLDGDGALELATAHLLFDGVRTWSREAQGWAPGITAPLRYPVRSLVALDADGDGRMDLAAVQSGASTGQEDPEGMVVLRGRGDGGLAPAAYHAAGYLSNAIAVADVNGDGARDLAVTGSGGLSVLLHGGGRYPAPWPYRAPGASAVILADLSGDGIAELVAATGEGVSVRPGDGNGGFGAPKLNDVGARPTALAAVDANRDGMLDVAYLIGSAWPPGDLWRVGVLLGVGDGQGSLVAGASYPLGARPAAIAAADLSGDGREDLVITMNELDTVRLMIGHGDGTFASRADLPAGDAPEAVAALDLNGDGRLDLAVANAEADSVSVLLNNSRLSFQRKVDYPVGRRPRQLAVGDIDGDGRSDLAVANQDDDTLSLLLGQPSGALSSTGELSAGDAPVALALADVNGDDLLDAVIGNASNRMVQLALGSGRGAFHAPMRFGGGRGASALATGDLDRDGVLELVTASDTAGTVSVLRAECR